MKTLRSETIVLFVQCSADPRLLEALRKTENRGGVDERMDEMHLSVRLLSFTPSQIALTESVRETVFLPWLYALNLFLFFCLEPW